MSYILDALRRAQAERERGQVPGLHAQPGLGATQRMRPAPGAQGRPGWLWALAGAGLVALVLVPLLMFTRGAGPQQPAAVAGPAVAPGSGVTAQPLPQLQPQLQPPPQQQPQPPLVVVAAAPTPKPAAVSGPGAVPGSGSPAAPQPTARQGTAPPAPAPATTGTVGTAPAAQAPVAGSTLPALPAAQDAPQLQAPMPLPATLPAPAPQPARAPAALPVASSPAVALPPPLTAEQRRDWPALAVGGSVWSDSPSARFVILGGQVVREGETTADGVLVERITPKSVVLRWRDQRASLPF